MFAPSGWEPRSSACRASDLTSCECRGSCEGRTTPSGSENSLPIRRAHAHLAASAEQHWTWECLVDHSSVAFFPDLRTRVARYHLNT
eukprot:5973794-Prymnesium_polylepis.1